MNDPQFQYAIIAFFSAWFALVAVAIWIMSRVGQAIDERHEQRRKGRQCDEAYEQDDWSATIGDCKPGECRVCDEAYEAEIEGERER